jgi:hypothetical protein
MKNIISIIATLAVIAVLFSSCSYSSAVPLLVTDNTSVKTGEAKEVVGIFGKKDVNVSIAKAAENGGITKVATVDFRTETSLFKTTYITIVTGE